MDMQLRTDIPGISWGAGLRAVEAAVKHAEELGIRIDAAIVDRAGLLVSFLGMPGAYLHSEALAIDKAYTAASFGVRTDVWPDAIGANRGLVMGIPVRPRMVVIGGGIPVFDGTVCIGGIGVSGGTEEQDIACAQVGINLLMSNGGNR